MSFKRVWGIGGVAVVLLWFCISSGYAAQIKVVKTSGEEHYQAVFSTMGQADYPYAIKTELTNRLLGKRLAVFEGYLKMRENIDVIVPYLEKMYKPVYEGDFLKSTIVGQTRFFDTYVQVDIEYVFLLSRDRYRQLKNELKGKVDIKEVESLKGDRRDEYRSFEITKSYWDKLVRFESVFSDQG